MKKRSEFEHKLNARGSKPYDYARYAEFEINVDALRLKRVKRLGIKSPGHSGKRNVFSILQRGTKKFPGDVSLCMQEIEYARSQKSYKKLSQILTRALRLHPSKPELWIYAAQLAMEDQGDVIEARSYMQRGLRFCKNSKRLWNRYLGLEFLHLAKIAARRRLLDPGSGSKQADGSEAAVSSPKLPDQGTGDDFNDALTDEDEDPTTDNVVALPPPSVPPALRPAAADAVIPIAIFDAATRQFGCDEEFVWELFEMAYDTDLGACKDSILDHMIQYLENNSPSSWRLVVCKAKRICTDMDPESPEFPAKLGFSLKILRTASPHDQRSAAFVEAVGAWLAAFLENPDLDPGLRQVMVATGDQLRRAGLGINS